MEQSGEGTSSCVTCVCVLSEGRPDCCLSSPRMAACGPRTSQELKKDFANICFSPDTFATGAINPETIDNVLFCVCIPEHW